MKDFSKKPTEDLVALLENEEKNDFLPYVDEKSLIKELFRRNEIGMISDEALSRITKSFLPPSPNGDERLSALQTFIATEEIILDITKVESLVRWNERTDDELMKLFKIFVIAGTDESAFFARSVFVEAFFRGIHTKLPEDAVYAFIRRQFPAINDENFRSIAETALHISIS